MIYIFSFTVSCLFLSCSEKKWCKNKLFGYILILLALLIPSVLAGLRDFSIGTDVELYGNIWFADACKMDFISYIESASTSSIGVLYALLNYLTALVTDDIKIFYFFLSFIETLLVYMGLKGFDKQISVPFGMFAYYTLFYNNTLNLLRQFLAFSIVLFSYQFLVKKKYFIFIILTLVAITAHSSSFVAFGLLILFLISDKIKLKFSVLIFDLFVLFSTVILSLFYQKILILGTNNGWLSERYDTYMENTVVGGRMIRIFFWMIILILALIAFYQFLRISKDNRLLITCTIMSFAMSFLLFMGNVYTIRFAYYYDAGSIILISKLPEIYKAEFYGKRSRYCIYFVLILLLLIRWYLEYVRSLNGQTYPYKFASF